MKRLLLTIPMLIFALSSAGQSYSLEAFKAGLRSPSPSTGKAAWAQEHGVAATAVRSMWSVVEASTINGYRVCIYSSNAQNARGVSQDVAARFMESFPGVAVSRGYTEPSYRVMVGSCVTSEEALVLWGRVKGVFDKAFIMRNAITLTELSAHTPYIEPENMDSKN